MYNVLVVDDEPLVRLTLKNMHDWESFGFFFGYEASHGRQALEILQGADLIDIVLLDVTMPVMDGLEFIQRVRLFDHKPEILIISSHNDFPLVRKAFKLGVHDYVLKAEMDPETIVAHLQTISTRLAATRRQMSHLSPVERKYLHRRFLKDLLHGQVASNVGELARQFDIRLCPSCICVVVATVQAFGLITQRYTAEQLPVFAENVVNCIAQILGKYPFGEVVSLNEERYGIFLSSNDTADHCISKVYDILDEIEQTLRHYLDITISYNISRLGEGFDSINALFRETAACRMLESRIVRRAKRYILEHSFDPELDLQEISEFVGITKSHLSYQYAKETGENLRDYLHKVRIEEAKKLLLNTNLKVYEVCYKVGYKNVESFSRVFKKLTSFSPNTFSRH